MPGHTHARPRPAPAARGPARARPLARLCSAAPWRQMFGALGRETSGFWERASDKCPRLDDPILPSPCQEQVVASKGDFYCTRLKIWTSQKKRRIPLLCYVKATLTKPHFGARLGFQIQIYLFFCRYATLTSLDNYMKILKKKISWQTHELSNWPSDYNAQQICRRIHKIMQSS